MTEIHAQTRQSEQVQCHGGATAPCIPLHQSVLNQIKFETCDQPHR